ncbi:hypothetical protein ACFQ4C_10965 [Larkinella insperata]|uniref:DUF4595 domain-containing protein n=2 Tax=Larkinella insperata TaxID=332158 RepID=A0ABW3Q6Z9_9BACT
MMKNWFSYGWITLALLACTLNDTNPTNTVCFVTEMIRYQTDQNGQQEISRQTLNYQNGRLLSYSDRSSDRAISFDFKYIGGKVASAYTPDRSTVLSLDYDEYDRVKTASYIINNKEQSVFSLYYDTDDRSVRLIRLVETRVTLPTSSFISSRIFQFSYGEIAPNTVDIVAQTVQNGYKDGSRTEEEMTFVQSADNHSPFYDSAQTILLALLALTNHTESDAARYLQRFDSRSHTRQIIAANGGITLRETSQFTTEYDNHFNPVRSTQSSHLTAPADSVPADRTYQHTFQYLCEE